MGFPILFELLLVLWVYRLPDIAKRYQFFLATLLLALGNLRTQKLILFVLSLIEHPLLPACHVVGALASFQFDRLLLWVKVLLTKCARILSFVSFFSFPLFFLDSEVHLLHPCILIYESLVFLPNLMHVDPGFEDVLDGPRLPNYKIVYVRNVNMLEFWLFAFLNHCGSFFVELPHVLQKLAICLWAIGTKHLVYTVLHFQSQAVFLDEEPRQKLPLTQQNRICGYSTSFGLFFAQIKSSFDFCIRNH